jgi:hypothetical protein
MNKQFEMTKLKILTWCIEDWVDLHAISWFIEEFYQYEDSSLYKTTTLKIIKNLLEKKLIIAGDLLEDDTFIPWNMSVDEITDKIQQEWNNLGRKLIPHEIVWFDITGKGEKEFEYLNSLPELENRDPFYSDDN